MRIVLRFDDICPTMDWEQWERAKALLDSCGAKALLGVVPDCQDPELHIDPPREDFWDYIRGLQKEGYCIAMHGYQHLYGPKHKSMVSGGLNTEFAGLSYEEQCRKIAAGKAALLSHGIETDIFFAPAHSYDANTLKALAANGFHYLSDGKSAKPYVQEGIMCIPCRSSGVPAFRNQNKDYMAVFHAHEWIREDKKAGYTALQHLCQNCRDSVVRFEDYLQNSVGNYSVQKFNERGYILFNTYIRPPLGRLKRAIL